MIKIKWLALPAATVAALLLSTSPASVQGVRYYVRAGATGAQTGVNWTDAFVRLPSTMVRGATYYIASGTYPGDTFNTAPSGTQLITIKGATVADHGSDTGWNSAFSVSTADGGSQAIWTSGLIFNTSYWIFDGAVGPVNSRIKTAYGFKINPVDYSVQVFNLSTAIQNITISHVTATAPSGDLEKFFLATVNSSTKSVHNVTLSHSLLDGWSNTVAANSAGLVMNDWLVEYNVILNGFSSATNHGEDINNGYGNAINLVIRHNWFEGRSSGTGTIVVLNAPAGPYYIYGNIFKNQTAGDGLIACVHENLQAYIYNNVVAGIAGGAWLGGTASDCLMTGEAFNNVLYNMDASLASGASGVSRNSNAYFNTTNTPTETNRYTATSSPFVNYAGNDLQLTSASASAMPAGMTLLSPYHIDLFGITRGADGKWDRGALEFNDGGKVTLKAPSNLRVVP